MVSKGKEEIHKLNKTFKEEIENIRVKIKDMKKSKGINEEATKTSLIMPLFKALGYDVFNVFEFNPEYTADFGVKKGEKVDYAIRLGGKVSIIVECKTLGANLNKAIDQLFRYFSVIPEVGIGILTDGARYMFFSDLEKKNIMDNKPFWEIDIEQASDKELEKLNDFSKEYFNQESIREELINNLFIKQLSASIVNEFKNPSKELIEVIKKNIFMDIIESYEEEELKRKVGDAFSNIIGISKEELTEILNCYKCTKELDREFIKSTETKKKTDMSRKKKIDLQRNIDSESIFEVVKDIFKENKFIDIEDLQCKEFNKSTTIFYGGGRKRWICRFIFSEDKAIMQISKGENSIDRYDIRALKEIYKYRNELSRALIKVL